MALLPLKNFEAVTEKERPCRPPMHPRCFLRFSTRLRLAEYDAVGSTRDPPAAVTATIAHRTGVATPFGLTWPTKPNYHVSSVNDGMKRFTFGAGFFRAAASFFLDAPAVTPDRAWP
jgi:hypothetical protein